MYILSILRFVIGFTFRLALHLTGPLAPIYPIKEAAEEYDYGNDNDYSFDYFIFIVFIALFFFLFAFGISQAFFVLLLDSICESSQKETLLFFDTFFLMKSLRNR